MLLGLQLERISQRTLYVLEIWSLNMEGACYDREET